MLRALDDWLLTHPKSTFIVTRAKFEGEDCFCCILHHTVRWQLDNKDFPLEFTHGRPKEFFAQNIAYDKNIEMAIRKAMNQ